METKIVDTTVLVAFLDKGHPDNLKTKILVTHKYLAVNPTVIHEAYHINRADDNV